ncbi:MAG: SIS domain-containing protein [Candidatus Promineifilaceae bacterium]|nr:SIS domain-containing protein [Candidatus Promineifilaceae bacterium]
MKAYSPLLNENSPLDPRARELIEDLNLRELQKALTLPTDDPLDQKRRNRVELTWGEMWAQPEKIQETLDQEGQAIRDAASTIKHVALDRIVAAGCGDSLASVIGVRSFYESLLGIPFEPIQALDFAYYNYQPINEKTLVIVLSSSGVTTRVVESLLLAKALGAQTLALSNTAGSALMNEADQRVLIHAERKGWPTQSSTSAMAILYQYGIELARQARPTLSAELDVLETELQETPGLIAQTLESHNESIHAIAEKEAERSLYLFSAAGPSYTSALFGAAKVKELSPDHALAIPLEEYHHYNSQKASEPLFLIAPNGPSLPRAVDTAREGKRFGGQVYSIVSKGNNLLDKVSDACFYLPLMDERLAPMVYSIPVQLFAYHTAMEKFRLAEEALETHE